MTVTERSAEPTVLRFPEGFRWGAATAAYQIEGATGDDGRRPSIWDTFARTPGNVHRGHTGDVACDHYHRYRDDVALMAELGIGTYRLSLAWPRIVPDGTGPANPRGLDFYDRLIDELLAHGIDPMVTLYHWDLPQGLEDAGGWPARTTAEAFADYAAIAAGRLADRVASWSTLNEPWCSAFLGYASGDHAPGRRDPGSAYVAAHHLLLAHGLGVQALRAAGGREVSITQLLTRVTAGDPADPHGVRAAELIDGLQNRMWLDPMLRGSYPPDLVPLFERFGAAPAIRDGDLATIAAPIDLLGVQYYQPIRVGARVGQPATGRYPGSEGVEILPRGADVPVTGMDWTVDATGLRDTLVRVATDYPGVPLMVTENGSAYPDTLDDAGVHDHDRIAYFDTHLRAAHAAISDGVDLRGYLAWSFLDNFEWGYGYAHRFGLVYVDYATQRRVPKDSAAWYRDVIRHNGLGTTE